METVNHAESTSAERLYADNNAPQKPPWNPAFIATITLLFSVLPGGIFHALNYERLGLAQKKVSTLTTNILLFLFIFIASFLIRSTILFGLFQLVFHIGCAVHFYKSQINLYRKYRNNFGIKASIAYPIVASMILYLLIVGLSYGISFLITV